MLAFLTGYGVTLLFAFEMLDFFALRAFPVNTKDVQESC